MNEPLTAEQILRKHLPTDCIWDEGYPGEWKIVNTPCEYVLKAMEEYASLSSKKEPDTAYSLQFAPPEAIWSHDLQFVNPSEKYTPAPPVEEGKKGKPILWLNPNDFKDAAAFYWELYQQTDKYFTDKLAEKDKRISELEKELGEAKIKRFTNCAG